VLIRALAPADGDGCDAIMRRLPEWFALEHGLVECSRAVREDGGFAALEDGALAGFATLRRTTDAALEITWLAIERARHGNGLGRALVEAAAARADAEGATFLTAWTLSASDPDPHYAATRAFYARLGFAAAAEAEIWGPENPAVLLVRSVTHARGPLT
jgi:GNAT superfamily N-acetyltransferase